ncbi:unnamed protein product [Spirodela intermedia]|uniref:Uncharacterized protein n=1 Tax=Spirodela intermedia TaxID=51605 RepID=A0A7I8JJ67_SPIIN|nr:unnamed protein product [Spirodela intermedia]CAA6670218.1 unnamed protein product [Spirodela intermedia]
MESSAALEDCLKLLRGERDEQKLAGLLLVTKLFQANDNALVLKVYEAVGTRFLERLLMTGTGTGSSQTKGGEDKAAYLRLSVTVLAAFCRVPEIASSMDMISKVPLLLQTLSKSCNNIGDGFTRLYESGVMRALASNVSSLPDGSRSMEIAVKLLQLILGKLPAELLVGDYQSEMSNLVPTIARQFAVLHSALKFDALHVLATILSSKGLDMKHDMLRSSHDKMWPTYVRIGVLAILQNRVASTEKLRALVLAESMMSTVGEEWLLDHNHLPDDQNPFPVDKCLMLVLESTRVEVAVVLNELAYLKYEASKSSSTEPIVVKQMNLALLFSLLEKIIRLVSNACETQGSPINERTWMKVIDGLNETTSLVLDFLHDARDHGERKGDDLLSAVRIIGRYLAEAPSACREKIKDLLEYILSIEGGEESRPFSSIQFMLPMLCQWTMDIDGCNVLASFGGHKAVAEFLARAIMQDRRTCDDDGTMFLACDAIMNVLLNREKIQSQLDGSHFVCVLQPLASWAEANNEDGSVVMMASSICSLVLDLTSEEALLAQRHVDRASLERLSQLVARSLSPSMQLGGDDVNSNQDLHQIVSSGYLRWGARFPTLRRLIEGSRTGTL